jgi:hypothetical protein
VALALDPRFWAAGTAGLAAGLDGEGGQEARCVIGVQLHAVAAAGSGAVAGEVERGGEFPCAAGPRKMRAAVAGRCRGRARCAEAGVRRARFGPVMATASGRGRRRGDPCCRGRGPLRDVRMRRPGLRGGRAGRCPGVAVPAEGSPVIAEVEGALRAITAAVPAASLFPSSASRPASSAAVKAAWSGTGMEPLTVMTGTRPRPPGCAAWRFWPVTGDPGACVLSLRVWAWPSLGRGILRGW